MKRCTLFLAMLAGLLSCDKQADQVTNANALLTSTTWTDPADEKSQLITGLYTFNSNGTFVEDYNNKKSGDKIIVTGTWKWISDTEVSILQTSMTANGEIFEFKIDERDRYIYRITEITNERMTATKRFARDPEDSGFTTEVTFEAAQK